MTQCTILSTPISNEGVWIRRTDSPSTCRSVSLSDESSVVAVDVSFGIPVRRVVHLDVVAGRAVIAGRAVVTDPASRGWSPTR